ncbi:MAG: hypothetical protein CAPSK01_001622 [Candidatus Accumulibacter vicinus]|uniref:Uncharacterized protein n=1 Tax=Candidatus Accumulibacter vicinus TaxID=2954382 RepID=A0A084Y224_9PROT|nr:MAG: hypothetical protein CAPSK01_001622 [Candidatus Accumulibacter vicinus]
MAGVRDVEFDFRAGPRVVFNEVAVGQPDFVAGEVPRPGVQVVAGEPGIAVEAAAFVFLLEVGPGLHVVDAEG